jgi:putative flippase GtrA
VASTVAYAILYLLLRSPLGADGANALALGLTAIANTQANRRFTFQIRGRVGLLRQHAAGAVVYLIALGLTAGALDVLTGLDPHPSRRLEVVVLVAATTVATVTRYVALRSWVFARRRRLPGMLRPTAR